MPIVTTTPLWGVFAHTNTTCITRLYQTVILKYTSNGVFKILNWFPSKDVVSKYISPHVIMSVQNLDFNTCFQILFRAYVQVSRDNNPTNTNSLITLDAIYLKPLDNKQVRHECMHVQNVQVITG